GEELEEHVPFLAGLLGVADFVQTDGVVVLQLCQQRVEFEVAFGGEQLADEFEGRREQDAELVALDPLARERGDEGGLAAAGQAEGADGVAPAYEVGLQ